FVDANNDEKLFDRIYGSTSALMPSIPRAPYLSLRLSVKEPDGKLRVVSAERYYPEASAFWCKHAEDTAALQSELSSERADRTAGDDRTAAALSAETRDRSAADSALQTALAGEAAARKQGD